MLRHRDQAKLRTTVEGLIKAIADDGRIHTTFNQIDRGHRPAVLGEPQPAEHPDPHRRGPPDPAGLRRRRRVRGAADRRLQPDRAAHHGPPVRRRGADRGLRRPGTTSTRRPRPGCSTSPPEQVDGELRAKIKAMNYGLAYGLSDFGLSEQLSIPVGRGARRSRRNTSRSSAASATTCTRSSPRPGSDGYTETILGRRRYLPDLTSDNRQRREMAERMALNAPIQGSAADIIKVAMLNVQSALKRGGAGLPDAAPGPRRARVRGGPGRAGDPARAGHRPR